MADCRGHVFTKKTFHLPAYCHNCTNLLWGVVTQGNFCTGLSPVCLFFSAFREHAIPFSVFLIIYDSPNPNNLFTIATFPRHHRLSDTQPSSLCRTRLSRVPIMTCSSTHLLILITRLFSKDYLQVHGITHVSKGDGNIVVVVMVMVYRWW